MPQVVCSIMGSRRPGRVSRLGLGSSPSNLQSPASLDPLSRRMRNLIARDAALRRKDTSCHELAPTMAPAQCRERGSDCGGPMSTIAIGGRSVGDDAPTYVIAEIGSNHDGSLNEAIRLIEASAGAGADCVKFQSFRADTLVAPSHPGYATLKRLSLPPAWYPDLKAAADRCGEGCIAWGRSRPEGWRRPPWATDRYSVAEERRLRP